MRVTGARNTGFCGIAGNVRALVGRSLRLSIGSTLKSGSFSADTDTCGKIPPVAAGVSPFGNAIQPKTVAPRPVSSTHGFHH